MSRTLQIALMLLTAALCGVCAWQWHRETLADTRWRTLDARHQNTLATLQQQTGKLTAWEQEITRLQAALTAAAASAAAAPPAPDPAILTQLRSTAATLQTQLQQALAERDTLAARLNQRTGEFNTLAEKYRKAR